MFMEKFNLKPDIKKPSPWWMLLIGALGAGCSYVPLLLLLVPGCMAWLILSRGWLALLGAMTITIAGTLAIFGTPYLVFPGIILLGALCLTILLRRKAPYFQSAMICAALYTVMFYALICLPGILGGRGAFADLQQIFSQTADQVRLSGALFPADQIDALLAQLTYIEIQIPIVLPGLLCAVGAVMSLVNLLICKRLCVRTGAPVKDMTLFCFWRAPKSFFIGCIVMLIGCVIGDYMQLPAMDAVWFAVQAIILVPFIVQGLAFLHFWLHLRRAPRPAFVFLYVLLVLSYPSTLTLLTFLGFLEQLLGLRKRFRYNKPSGQ